MRIRAFASLLVATTLSGCGLPGAGGDHAATQPAEDPNSQLAIGTYAPSNPTPADPQETAQRVFRIQIFQLTVPAGTISNNAAFWRPADETFLGFEMHRALDRTGVRVGKAPFREMSPLIAQYADVLVNDTLTGLGGKTEMELRHDLPAQTIFWCDPRDQHMEGRDFAHSQNLYVIAFNQLQRRPDFIHLEFAPAVRELRPELSLRNGQVTWTPPDVIYALGIGCELGIDDCIIIGPSEVATHNSLVLGRAFFMEDGAALKMERVLVIHPTAEIYKPAQRPQ